MHSAIHSLRKYTLQEEGKLQSQLRIWFIKNSGELLFGKETPKEICGI